jgi:hypothetical protein
MPNGGTQDFSSFKDAQISPLAKTLFAIQGVSGVFYGGEFVTVSILDESEWPVVKPDIFAAIMEHYSSGQELFSEQPNGTDTTAQFNAITDDDDEVVAMIKELIETRIRSEVQKDGGDIAFRG